MRYGFTTGSCAAAAAKAAAYMLLTGHRKESITIETPKGIPFLAEILDIERTKNQVCCAVRKDGGDDPDVTTGALIYAAVSIQPEDAEGIRIEGGSGVGRVTKPGLDQPVGSAAINHVPRQMIQKEVMEVCQFCDYKGALMVVISVSNGEELAKQTFNPRLGIEGGISILGTSGIVEPMSKQALLETIRLELRQKREQGAKVAAVSPGNYGLDFMKKTYGYDLDRSVKCSNFIGDTIDMAAELGYEAMLLTGHIGKLVKVSGGIMNTHSKEADCRMELLVAIALLQGVEPEVLRQMLACVTTEDAIRILDTTGKRDMVMQELLKRIVFYLEKRAQGRIAVGCILYANEYGELAKTENAKEFMERISTEIKE